MSAGTEGDDVRVLEQQKRVGNAPFTPLHDQPGLQLERFLVPDQPQAPDLEPRSEGGLERSRNQSACESAGTAVGATGADRGRGTSGAG
jgi:hypothetical protein